MGSEYNPEVKKISFWKTFRLVFVVFSLYLMGDAFYRWDGFKYYAYFSEFLFSVALITIIWSIVSVLAAVFIWLLISVLKSLPMFISRRINAEFILLFICFLILSGEMVLLGKSLIFENILSYGLTQIVLYACCGSAFFAWLFYSKSHVIHERITPLVWLYGIIVMLSLPMVVYSAFLKDSKASQEIIQASVVNKSGPNIIYVIFDAMTARDMSVYGYHRETTPFISEWAKEASVFLRLEAGSNWTPPTVASIMSGKRVWTHRVYQPFGNEIVKGNIESLPLLLRRNGYRTMAYISNHYATAENLGIDNGFDINYPVSTFKLRKSSLESIDSALHSLFIGKIRLPNWFTQQDFIIAKIYNLLLSRFDRAGDTSKLNRYPEIEFNKFLEDISNNIREPYFAWIHIYPPHDPYLPPEPYMGMFDPSTQLRTSTEQDKVKYIHLRYRDREMHSRLYELQPIIDTLRARYDEDIRYCDEAFKDFILKLKERDKLKNTIVILSSDHGESFEHIKVGHGDAYLYEELTHIPFIIKEPGQTEGRILNNMVAQIDISATILDLAGIPVPSWMEGRTLKPLLGGGSLSDRPVFSMNFESNPSRGEQIEDGVIAVWEGDYKLIHYLGNRKSEIFNQNTLLFNLIEDPGETKNLFEKEPEIGQHLLSMVQGNLTKANEKIRMEK